jgi:hypothetical protein
MPLILQAGDILLHRDSRLSSTRYVVYEGSQQQIDVKQIFCDRLWQRFLNIFSLMSKGGGEGGMALISNRRSLRNLSNSVC